MLHTLLGMLQWTAIVGAHKYVFENILHFFRKSLSFWAFATYRLTQKFLTEAMIVAREDKFVSEFDSSDDAVLNELDFTVRPLVRVRLLIAFRLSSVASLSLPKLVYLCNNVWRFSLFDTTQTSSIINPQLSPLRVAFHTAGGLKRSN